MIMKSRLSWRHSKMSTALENSMNQKLDFSKLNFSDLNYEGQKIPDEKLPIALGYVYLPSHLHKFIAIKDGKEVTGTREQLFELITLFHPSTPISGNWSDPSSCVTAFEFFVLPWIRRFKSLDYKTNVMHFSTD